jgi:hypothetical protein
MMVSSTHKIEERKIVDMISRAFSMLWITLNQAFIMNNYISVLTCIVCVFPLLVRPYAIIVPATVKKCVRLCFVEQINYMSFFKKM